MADHAVWIVAFLLYACDATKLLPPRELLLVEAGRGRLGTGFSDQPFTLAGRILAWAPLLRPHRGVFVAPWGRVWVEPDALAATLAAVERRRGVLGGARVLALVAFALLFVAGPVLTRLLGADAAVLLVAAALYPTVLAAIVWLWWRRRRLELSGLQALGVSAEILVCPAFLPNLVRKLTARLPIEADGAQVLAAAAPAEVKAQLLTRIETRAEELLRDDAGLRAYLDAVRSAR